ncbi:hypothetical protein F2Q69_00011898 [Brassica cretica]|uniref:Uncharacterized protein n=1 Tax=Brassica cretica TaxID=69181 RepID=A0A8S9QUF6_BRACR|nr:hypothetical protein F2Q69_00011898 [Brassica cretica]
MADWGAPGLGERHGVDELFKQSVNLGDGISSDRQRCRIWPKNSSASSDLAVELIVVVRSGRRTRQRGRIWPKNSSVSSDLAEELIVVVVKFGSEI